MTIEIIPINVSFIYQHHIHKINSVSSMDNLEVKVARIEERLENIEGGLISIRDNHLNSIYRKLDNQKTWTIGLLVTALFTLIGVIINLCV